MLLKDKRVFIVEDDVINRSIMQTLLERDGATVAFERWGMDTEKRLLKFAPVHIILLDLMFPDNVSGYDIFDRIRLMADFRDVPIVAVSASDEIQKTAIKGFSGYIRKPIEMTLFAKQVAAAINLEPIWHYR